MSIPKGTVAAYWAARRVLDHMEQEGDSSLALLGGVIEYQLDWNDDYIAHPTSKFYEVAEEIYERS